jgi:hypothetical protein
VIFWDKFVSFSTKSWEIFGCICFFRIDLAKFPIFGKICQTFYIQILRQKLGLEVCTKCGVVLYSYEEPPVPGPVV